MEDIQHFAQRIPDFYNKKSSEQVELFSYYITDIQKQDIITPQKIQTLFEECRLPPYSNISAYLNRKSTKSKKLLPLFIKGKGGYKLSVNKVIEIEKLLSMPAKLEPSGKLLNSDLFKNSRGYLVKMVTEASLCVSVN